MTLKRPDPTGFGSGSGSGSYLDMFFFMFRKINNFVWHFLTEYKHLMTHKIKEKLIFLTKLYFRQFYMTRKLELHTMVFLWTKDPDPVFY